MNQLSTVAHTQVGFTSEEVSILKTQIMPGATDPELALFGKVCAQTGLSPFARQIFAVSRMVWNKELQYEEKKWTFQTSVDGLRLVAQRSGEYEGQTLTQWCGEDSKWVDVWLKTEYPRASRVGVYRKNFREPLYATAMWDSYVQTYKNKKTGATEVNSMWNKMPELMLAKCAESLALRKAFPQETSNLYSKEEMGQAENEPAAPQIESKPDTTTTPSSVPPKVASGSKVVIGAKKSISPDLFITVGKQAGTKITEMSKTEIEAWMINANKLDKSALAPEIQSDMQKTYQAMQNYLEELESGQFAQFQNGSLGNEDKHL